MTGKRIGYRRVSSADQNPARQLEGIELDKIFTDYASAKSTERPQLKLMLDYVREDDIIFIHSMDRFARNVKDLRNLVDGLCSRKIQVHFIKENLLFNGEDSSMSNLLLSIMGAFAEFEYEFIKERQREGIDAAKKLGRFRGGKLKLSIEKLELLKKEMQGRKSKSLIARELGISRSSIYKYLEMIREHDKNVGSD